jgi:hypothetical protein
MVYNIAEACKEWMVTRNIKALSMHEQMTERQKIAEAPVIEVQPRGVENHLETVTAMSYFSM